MPQKTVLKCRGLYTFPNKLGELPEGALVEATNVVIDREGVISSRRGLKLYGDALPGASTIRSKQLIAYKGRILRHSASVLEYDSDGAGDFAAFSGSVMESETGLRIKSVEVNGNLYFTTSNGVMKISVTSASQFPNVSISAAGGIKALDGQASIDYTQTGFFTQDSVVAYRIFWGIKDNNNNLILGTPSESIVITNPILDLLIRDYNNLLFSLDVAAAADGGDALSDTDYNTLAISTNSSATTLYNSFKTLCAKLDTDMTVTDFWNGGATSGTAVYAQHTTATGSSPTSAMLLDLQAFYDDIVVALIAQPTGKISAAAQAAGAFQAATTSAAVDLTFTVPSDATVNHFYQVYRTPLVTGSGTDVLADLRPGDDVQLVYEANPSAAEVAAGQLSITDITPESFLGADAYTNPNTGEGISQANEIPPLCADIAVFKNSTFYANTSTRHRKTISLLSGTNIENKYIYVGTGSTLTSYQFVTQVKQIVSITCVSGANLKSSGTGDYFDLYSANDASHYRIWFNVSSGNTAPSASSDITLLEVDVAGGDTSTQVASKLTVALNQEGFWFASPSSAVITVTNEDYGICTAPTETVVNAGFLISVTTAGAGNDATNRKVGIGTGDTPSQIVDETARNLVRVINRQTSGTVNASYLSSPSDVPGKILLENRSIAGASFFVVAQDSIIGAKFNPDLSPDSSISNISVANPTVITSTAHGLSTGDSIAIVDSNSTPTVVGIRTVTVLTANTFTVAVNVTVLGSSGSFIKVSNAKTSDNEVNPNRVYYSKTSQPEAVPLVNYFDIGARDQAILRVVPLRDSLFVFKANEIYRVSGDGTTNFQVTLFDSSTSLLASDTACVLNNMIYLYSDQGVATVSETGVSIVSRQIENEVIQVTQYENFSSSSFAVSYETDRSYILFTVSSPSDTVATQAFRYNTFTSTWTHWDMTKTCGIVNRQNDKLYLGAGDTNYIEIERKSYTREDYADRETALTLPEEGLSGTSINLGALFGVEAGDVFVQTQYLTANKFNRLLRKLDQDSGVADADYLSLLEAGVDSKLSQKLVDLCDKLNADTGVSDSDYTATVDVDFETTQTEFNTIVDKLNNDSGVTFDNYTHSTGTTQFEVTVDSVNSVTRIITLVNPVSFVAGPFISYKSIPAAVTWAPQHFGDPSIFKQVRDTTILYDNKAFTKATASYSSDSIPYFEEVAVQGEGTGIWGSPTWGRFVWGGEGTSAPFRTYVPRNKARCRFINCRLEHSSAFEQWSIYGVSFTFDPKAERAYK
jgi:hypothetical protein